LKDQIAGWLILPRLILPWMTLPVSHPAMIVFAIAAKQRGGYGALVATANLACVWTAVCNFTIVL